MSALVLVIASAALWLVVAAVGIALGVTAKRADERVAAFTSADEVSRRRALR